MCTLRTIYDTIAYRKKMDTAIRVSGGQESRLYFMKENNCKMTELPADELPYEKCINKGAEVLSDAELLAVILRTGSKGINALELSRKILDAGAPRNGLLGLYHMTIPQLCQIRGIGEVKAVQLKCIAELSRRIAGQSAWSALNFKDAASIADYFMEEMRHLEQAVFIILLHNHPSGDPTPSEEDKSLTKRISLGGELVGIRLLDHIIVGDRCYASFREMKIL